MTEDENGRASDRLANNDPANAGGDAASIRFHGSPYRLSRGHGQAEPAPHEHGPNYTIRVMPTSRMPCTLNFDQPGKLQLRYQSFPLIMPQVIGKAAQHFSREMLSG
jgi:hypothetical protein